MKYNFDDTQILAVSVHHRFVQHKAKFLIDFNESHVSYICCSAASGVGAYVEFGCTYATGPDYKLHGNL